MIRHLRTLALAMGAVFLLGALGASSASATTNIWFEGESGIQTVTGTQEADTWDLFTITNGVGQTKRTTTCRDAHLLNETATVDETESELNLTPVYGNCTSSEVPTTVSMNGCDYRFHTPRTSGGVRTASAEIVCPPGNEIVVTVSLFGTHKCIITVPPQTPGGHITLTNITGNHGTTREVTAKTTLTGIHYVEHPGTGFGRCGDATFTGTDGTYSGVATLKGQTHAGAQKGIWVDV
jgi:hypothetical protein